MSSIDAIVLLSYIAGVAGLGIWLGRGTHDLAGYLLGDRRLPWWAILGSIVATETSTATFLSVPGLSYAAGGDCRFLQLALGFFLGRVLISVTLLPLFFRGQIFSAYQILSDRFGGATKQTAAIIFLVTRNLGDGLRLFLTALVLEQVTGFSLVVCIVFTGCITMVYTLIGGIKAVVWNDCIQLLVYIAGALIAGAVIIQRLPGGLNELLAHASAHEKLRLWDFRWSLTDPYALGTAVIGGMFLTLGTHGTDQMMVQRYLCAASQRDAARALIASGAVVFVQFAVFLLLGIGLATYYASRPPQQPFTQTDQVFATFIVRELPVGVGIVGCVLAAVFSAAMSTLSSSINSSAASAINDLYLPLCRNRLPTDAQQLLAGRMLTVVFAALQIVVAIAARDLQSNVVTEALKIAGFSSGLLLGIFALGVLTRQVGQTAGALGMAAGLAALSFIAFGLPGWRMAWPWFPVVGSVTTFVAGVTVQCFLPRRVGQS